LSVAEQIRIENELCWEKTVDTTLSKFDIKENMNG
jgi:hypothetical protein